MFFDFTAKAFIERARQRYSVYTASDQCWNDYYRARKFFSGRTLKVDAILQSVAFRHQFLAVVYALKKNSS